MFDFAQDLRTESGKSFSVKGKQRLLILLCEIHIVRKTPKKNGFFEHDSKQVISLVHFNM